MTFDQGLAKNEAKRLRRELDRLNGKISAQNAKTARARKKGNMTEAGKSYQEAEALARQAKRVSADLRAMLQELR